MCFENNQIAAVGWPFERKVKQSRTLISNSYARVRGGISPLLPMQEMFVSFSKPFPSCQKRASFLVLHCTGILVTGVCVD